MTIWNCYPVSAWKIADGRRHRNFPVNLQQNTSLHCQAVDFITELKSNSRRQCLTMFSTGQWRFNCKLTEFPNSAVRYDISLFNPKLDDLSLLTTAFVSLRQIHTDDSMTRHSLCQNTDDVEVTCKPNLLWL